MTFDPDDWRWTAYVLDELDADDRAELEATMAADPEARAYVDSLRGATAALERDLSTAPAPARLDDVARKRIERAAAAPARRSRWQWWAGGATVAAAVAAVAMLRFGAPTPSDSDGKRGRVAAATGSAAPAGPSPVPSAGSSFARKEEQSARDQQLRQAQKNAIVGNVDSPRGYYDQSIAPAIVDGQQPGTEAYRRVDENGYIATAADPRSTFSIDVDRASYANVRRFLEQGHRPPIDAVRVEELVNYFPYEHVEPRAGQPFSITSELGPSPWHERYQLLKIGIQAPAIADEKVPPRNLVFLVDTSGSMQADNKLPLLKQSLALLVETLRPEDRVSIVAYAGAAGLVLPPTSGSDPRTILAALAALESGGSTNGGAGIELAYQVAAKYARAGGVNRVILCTDGDYNVGTTSDGDLTRLIERERERGIFLTVLGFGQGNVKDATMEQLADRGNGNYGYIDSLLEARKLLVQEAGGTLVTVAKDVKLQLEFNPAAVAGYRLVGYENRVLAHQDFNDDKKDAGEIGAGHAVTALYELIPAGEPVPTAGVDPLKYQAPRPTAAATSGELLTINVRYKRPESTESNLLTATVDTGAAGRALPEMSVDFRWAAAIAGFGMMLRDSPYRGDLTWADVQALAAGAVGTDLAGYRKDALTLIKTASQLPAKP